MKDLRERYVGREAERYEEVRQGKQWDWEHETLAALLDEIRPAEVLDVPCGTGRFWSLDRDRGIEAIGVDLSPDMLRQARARGWETVHEGDVFRLPRAGGAFDLVVCFRLLNWMTEGECRAALREMGCVSSTLVASVGLGSGWEGRTRLQDRAVFADAGWEIHRSLLGYGHRHYRIVVCRR